VIAVDRAELDLMDSVKTKKFITDARLDGIILAAAKVGGILANNNFPVDFLYDNLVVETNVLGAAHAIGVERLVFLGSTCVYPRDAVQPLRETSLLTGPLEPTNEWYAIAKIAGLKLCQALRRQYGRDYISVMPTNLYGPYDNYHPEYSHMVPALIRRIHEAKKAGATQVPLWGTGKPRREIMHVDDCADAIVFLLEHYSGEDFINIGQGEDHTVLEIAKAIAEVIGWQGEFIHDLSKPDGTPRKLVAVDRLFSMGWRPQFGLHDGLANAYDWFRHHHEHARL
jgi:GDP-L-fucose synthase